MPERPDGRAPDALRPTTFELETAPFAEGSCTITMGSTRVLCTASVEPGVPGFREGIGGWVTAEYAMLPRATQQRTTRERRGARGRTQEIQRLIGRSLRAAVDLVALGERTVTVDCDVLVDGDARLDLEYVEDVAADVDFNVVSLADGRFVEVQGTAEGAPFDRRQLDRLVDLAQTGIRELLSLQRAATAGTGSSGGP